MDWPRIDEHSKSMPYIKLNVSGEPQMTAPASYSTQTLADAVGHDFGPSDPFEITQEMINNIADVTGDHQWIHVDVEKATKFGPFGGPVAHGFLTLSLLAAATESSGVVPPDAKAVLNYCSGKVRFLAPVLAGSSVRSNFKLVGVLRRGAGAAICA
ncbi:MaoC family dehydratase [Ruegeria sp. 2205SS24-7]|uniref:MaoC family dehydratase n=1 Tax=Ruegeria discodermiae TaxID=3064389 RepID=UPI0027417051|nr:MaoC family dehydratase [Ruegeria sp. 2205SS24-7]MDP5217666.1 MaoC family dehydratase [Ruegeria sp. 2205SS24-7]